MLQFLLEGNFRRLFCAISRNVELFPRLAIGNPSRNDKTEDMTYWTMKKLSQVQKNLSQRFTKSRLLTCGRAPYQHNYFSTTPNNTRTISEKKNHDSLIMVKCAFPSCFVVGTPVIYLIAWEKWLAPFQHSCGQIEISQQERILKKLTGFENKFHSTWIQNCTNIAQAIEKNKTKKQLKNSIHVSLFLGNSWASKIAARKHSILLQFN